MNSDFLVASVSGVLVGISACALPLYPVLLNHLTRSREDPRWVSLFFTAGLSGVYFILYALMGVLAAASGYGMVEAAEQFRGRLLVFGALFSWSMAAFTVLRGIRLPTIQILRGRAGSGYMGALLSGVFFGTVITPCNAPFLITGILPAIASRDGVITGMLLLGAFSFFMGAPVLLLGWASSIALRLFSFVGERRRSLEVLSAVFLVVVGFYFFLQYLLV
ncbi:MAG: cytochrome c biogenesis protein CcdA [Candidatus Altiarchaeota archaeon]